MQTTGSNGMATSSTSLSTTRTDSNRQQVTGALAAARQEYVAAARQGRAGRDVQTRYAGQIDAIVQQLAELAREHTGAALAVCAVGGYGRRALSLHSDVDVLLLFEEKIGAPEERFINALLQPLWDLGL